jgi:hypothetical protein
MLGTLNALRDGSHGREEINVPFQQTDAWRW